MSTQIYYIIGGLVALAVIVLIVASFISEQRKAKALLQQETLYALLDNHVRQMIAAWVKANISKVQPSELVNMPSMIAQVLRRIANEFDAAGNGPS